MRIQWDAALVAATARALDVKFRGSRIRGYELDPVARRLVLHLREATLVWDLHPQRLGLHILSPAEPPPEARPLPARLARVWSPPDDRILVLETRRVRGRPPRGTIVLELFPNQENVVVTEGDDATVRVLLRTREGDRTLRRGQPYVFPPPSDRAGAMGPLPAVFFEELLRLPQGDRKGVLLRSLAWSSPLSAAALLSEGGEALWRRLQDQGGGAEGGDTPVHGAVVMGPHGPQPYPVPLPERTLSETGDLLDAFRETEARSPAAGAEALLPGALLESLDAAVQRARGRVARLEEERDTLDDPDRLQGWGDLLLARFHLVREGADEVELEGFDGEPVRIPLDRTLSPDGNARRFYDRAARLKRAREDLPGRIREARAAWEALEALAERARRGESTREEVAAAIPESAGAGRADAGPVLPYRRFRSTGGVEIRVGRGAARNDDLTFHHSRPDDIWLHARHAAGAHVILRWDGSGSPPPGDLEEAAVLAALHSKARTSGSVPVDWTRRKHVRKPRKAPPGAVLPEQVKTVFVEPDEALLERLKDD